MTVTPEARRKQLQLDFRARLQRALDAKGWTQKDLAQRLARRLGTFAESSVTGYLRHNALPNADVLFELPDVLDVSLDWLLLGRGDQRPPTTREAPDTQFLEGGRTALDEARRELETCLRDLGVRWNSGDEASRRAARRLELTREQADRAREAPHRRKKPRTKTA